MLKSVYHQQTGKGCFPLNDKSLRITLRVGKGEVNNVLIRYDDPFNGGPSDSGKYEGKFRFNKDMTVKFSDELYDYGFVDITTIRRRFKYHFVLESKEFGKIYLDSDGQKLEVPEDYNGHGASFSFGFVEEGKLFKAPEWVKETIGYQIFPERFSNGNKDNDPEGTIGGYEESDGFNKMYGGDLKGIIEKIDYIKYMGFNGIYLNPIFKSPTTHKYDTEDYFEIDSQFGTNEEFDELIRIAHKNGIKVMIDGVFNHCGENFFAGEDVIKNKENSRYKDGFTIYDYSKIKKVHLNLQMEKSFDYECFGGSLTMPRLNGANPEVEEYLLKIVEFGTDKGVDGGRMDVADEIAFTFGRKMRNLLETKYPHVFLLGEVGYDATDFLSGDQFHSTMNYLIKRPIEDYFGINKISSEEFLIGYNKAMFVYNDNVNKYLFNLLGTHDTDRFLHNCKSDINRYLMCYSFILLIEGCPSIYYGDEIGMDGKGDKYSRHPMLGNEIEKRKDISDVFKEMIKIRKENIDSIYSDSKITIENGIINLVKGDLNCYFNNTNNDVELPSGNCIYCFNVENKKLKPQSFAIFK